MNHLASPNTADSESTSARSSLLYVNGTDEGGSLMSTTGLLNRVARLNVQPTLIQAAGTGSRSLELHRRLTNLEVKSSGSVDRGPVAVLNRRLGRRTAELPDRDYPTLSAVVVENAAINHIPHSDVIVVSSVSRPAWMRLRRRCTELDKPCVLYLRETALLPHLHLADPPDLLLTNSQALQEAARAMGFNPEFVPSVVELDEATVTSTRERVLLINPTRAYGLDTALALALKCPDFEFVLQEASSLNQSQRSSIAAALRDLPNVEFRVFSADVRDVFRDAQVLIAPYGPTFHSARPRAVLEAQWNAIPILAADHPGLRETVGPGGMFVPTNAQPEEWATTLRTMLSEPTYGDIRDAAREHATRPEVQPANIADQFVRLIRALV